MQFATSQLEPGVGSCEKLPAKVFRFTVQCSGFRVYCKVWDWGLGFAIQGLVVLWGFVQRNGEITPHIGPRV